MNTIRILVNSSTATLGDFLTAQLSPSLFNVTLIQPGTAFVEAARHGQPHIVVIDHVHDRTDAVQMDIAALKQLCPEARIIALSKESSTKDAQVVEAGVFFYLVTASSQPHELLRLIDAAAQAVTATIPEVQH